MFNGPYFRTVSFYLLLLFRIKENKRAFNVSLRLDALDRNKQQKSIDRPANYYLCSCKTIQYIPLRLLPWWSVNGDRWRKNNTHRLRRTHNFCSQKYRFQRIMNGACSYRLYPIESGPKIGTIFVNCSAITTNLCLYTHYTQVNTPFVIVMFVSQFVRVHVACMK